MHILFKTERQRARSSAAEERQTQLLMGTIAYGEAVSWSPVQEDTLFAEDGLKYVAELTEMPPDVLALESSVCQSDCVDFCSRFSADETASDLRNLFATQTSPYARYFRYRQNALEQLWLKRVELENNSTRRKSDNEKTRVEDHVATTLAVAVGKRRTCIDFSSRVSLLLLIPLLKSQSKTDPALAEHSAQVLFQCLKECLPNSLHNEPLSCVTGLADLLTDWLVHKEATLNNTDDENSCAAKQGTKEPDRPLVQSEIIVGCLLSLACSRLSLRLFVKTLLVIQQTKESLGSLPLGNVLANTVQYEKCGCQNNPNIVLASKLRSTWQYNVPHAGTTKGNVISCDGHFLYITHGSCLIKLGSGKHGTLRGHVYTLNTNLPDGFTCFINGELIYRPKTLEKTYQHFADIIDTTTLKVSSQVEYKPNEKGSNKKTVNIISDGVLIYWLYYFEASSGSGQSGKSSTNSAPAIVDIFLEVLEMKQNGGKYIVMSVQEPVVMKFKQENVSNEFPMSLAMRSVSASHPSQDENSKTSCGLTVNVLLRTPIFSDGTNIVMVIGHPNYQGYPVCKAPFNRCFSVMDGKFVRDDNLVDIPTAENPRWQSISLASTGVCYDSINNLIWTSSEDWVDEWLNIGTSSYHHVVHKLSPKPRDPVPDNDLMAPVDCITAIALQISFLCTTVSTEDTKEEDPSYDFTLDQEYERYLLDIMDGAIRERDSCVLHCVMILVQTLFLKAYQNNTKLKDDIVAPLRLMVWKIISSETAEFSEKVQKEACHTLRRGLGIFYPSLSEQSAVMMILLNEPEKNGIPFLKNILLSDFAEALRIGLPSKTGCVGWFAEDVVFAIIKKCTAESCFFISLVKEGKTNDYQFPIFSPLLDYLRSVITKILEELYVGQDATYHGNLENLLERLVGGFKEVSKALLDVCVSMDGNGNKSSEETLSLLHNITKSTLHGQVLPFFLTALSSEKICKLPICKSLASPVMELTISLAKIASFHRKLCPPWLPTSCNLSQVKCFVSSAEKDSKRPFDKVSIPKPWLGVRTVSSMHPVCDEYKMERTVTLFGAKNVFVKFDERCATQYDYDKLVVYAGSSTSSPKVGEYGGNSYGYGGRSVVKTGWPKDVVKVTGDTVTLFLEVKSTRERATPDKAIWGFSCTIAADQELLKSKSACGLDFFTDVALASSYLMYYLLNLLYCGTVLTDEELRCSHLLKSRLLQRCIWKESVSATVIYDSPTKACKCADVPSAKLASDVLDKLRTCCNRKRPTLRPSIHSVVRPEEIEVLILSAAVKHYGLSSCVSKFELATGDLSKQKEFTSLLNVAEEGFFKVDSLVRQLQAMAELEKKWWQELQDICKEHVQPSAAFFNDYHLQEDKAKELELLCSMKTLQFDPLDHEKTVGKLIQLLDRESKRISRDQCDGDDVTGVFPRTTAYVKSIMERAELLLNVTIMGNDTGSEVSRSTSNTDKPSTTKGVESLAPVLQVTRSVSAPHLDQAAEHLLQGIEDVQRFRRWDQTLRSIHKPTQVSSETKECPTSVVEQILTFIAGTPDQAISCGAFLFAATTRWRRGKYRQLAILHMSKLATIASTLGVTGIHLLGVVVSIMSQGTKLDDLECGGMLSDVCDEYGMLLRHLVDQSVGMLARYCEKLIVLATTPFTLCERQDVLRSSLILMINKLCSSTNQDTGLLDLSQRNHAWRSFQVLIDRLVSWENDKAHNPQEIEWSGVARQVATVLTSYLKYLENKISKHDVVTCVKDPLHEVLELLHRISGSHLGECVLSQPQMIKILLSVVIDRQASPKHVLTALTLLHSALPLTDPNSSEPLTSPSAEGISSKTQHGVKRKPSYSVIKVFLNKLGELLLPYNHSDTSSTHYKTRRRSTGYGTSVFSVFVHNRGDIAPHEIVQKVLSSSGQPFLFQVGLGSQMERAITLNRELSEQGFAEVLTDKMTTCLKQATRLALSGICVSISSPQDVKGLSAESSTESQTAEIVCHERNKNLVGFGNMRPYVSGNVAHNMASEVVSLLRNLLNVNSVWSEAVKEALMEGLDNLVVLVHKLNDTYETDESEWFSLAQQVLATLCSLGGFKETIRAGCVAMISEEGLRKTRCRVQTVSSEQNTALVVLDDDIETYAGTSFEVPLSTLTIPHDHVLPFADELSVQKLVTAITCILEDKTTLESLRSLFANNDSDLEIIRIMAEIKTRALALFDVCVDDEQTVNILMTSSPDLLSSLLTLACSLDPGERQVVIEVHCEELRSLFKEYVRPVHHEFSTEKKRSNMPNQLHITREFPLVRGCVFSRELTSVHYVNDPGDNISASQPRGAMIFADKAFPERIASYYWEADIVSLGEGECCDSAPFLSLGFIPNCFPGDGVWKMPIGSCLIHSNGRAIHYTSGGALSWKSVTLNMTMREHDVIGCGWERQESEFDGDRQMTGRVYFTRNGKRLAEVLDSVSAPLYPAVHVQKKNIRVLVNFGSRPFRYQEANQRPSQENLHSMSMEEIRSNFQQLPFCEYSDHDGLGCVSDERRRLASDSETEGPNASSSENEVRETGSISVDEKEYNTSVSQLEFLASSYDQMLDNGPPKFMVPDDEESSSNGGKKPKRCTKDPRNLLVKAWETKVFPTIRRRFRSEADRRSGLEQIRGALMEGLIDIAMSTMEDLYEDSGGLPNTLAFPRIEDIEAELDRTTVNDIRQGMTIQIICSSLEALPNFAVPGMRKTFGLDGVVQEIDKRNELVLVDVYIRDEGSVVRYWYPVNFLKPQPPAFGRLSSLTFVDQEKASFEIYTELWNCETTLTKMHSRLAAIKILGHMRKVLVEKQGISDVDTDWGHIFLLAGHLLRTPQADGTVTARNIVTTSSLKECLKTTCCSPLAAFFKDEEVLKQHLVTLVLSRANEGPKMKEICGKIFLALEEAPSTFSHQQYNITNLKMRKDIHFENAAVTAASCHGTPDYFIPRVRLPSVQIFGYYGRRRLTKDGNVGKYKLVQYPDYSNPNNSFSGDAKMGLNPEKFLPCNRFHLRFGSSNTKGLVLRMDGMPLNFLLCLSFIETLLEVFSSQNCSVQNTVITSSGVLTDIFKLLQNFLSSTPSSPFVRELVFHILAQTLRLLWRTESAERLRSFLDKASHFLTSLKTELFKLTEKEVSVSRAVALEYVLNCNFEKVKFTSYFQALFEVVLATAQLQGNVMPVQDSDADSPRPKESVWDTTCEDVSELTSAQEEPVENYSISSEPSSLTNLSIEVFTEAHNPGTFVPFFASLPSATDDQLFTAMAENASVNRATRPHSLRRQRVRERRKRTWKQASPLNAEGKGEEEREQVCPPWFKKLASTLAVLHHLVDKEKNGRSVALDTLVTSLSFSSMAWDRILVVTNIPVSVTMETIIEGIMKAARPGGGVLQNGGIYMEEDLIVSRPRTGEEPGDQSSGEQPVQSYKSAVVQLRTSVHIERVKQRLQQDKVLASGNTSGNSLQVLKVNSALLFEGGWSVTKACQAWENFLHHRLVDSQQDKGFCSGAFNALREIFTSCWFCSRNTREAGVSDVDGSEPTSGRGDARLSGMESGLDTVNSVTLSEMDICESRVGNLLNVFLKHLQQERKSSKEEIADILQEYGCIEEHGSSEESSPKALSFQGFLRYVSEWTRTDKRSVWKAILACGFNFNHQRSTEVFPSDVENEHARWTFDDDKKLIQFINEFSKNLSTSPQRLNPEEIFFESEFANPCFESLKQFSQRSIGSRFVLHKYVNQSVQRLVLPVVDLRVSKSHSLSTAALLSSAKELLFRNTKISELNRVLDLSAHRAPDDPSPEVSLDPLETLEADKVANTGPQLYQVAKQLSRVPSAKLRVKVATGGDPSFPLRVSLRGEQVLGLGGAYRHFMWIMAREVQSNHVGLLIPCPSAAANRNKGKFILRPGSMSLCERQLLVFFGQLLGIALRSDIPLALDILPSFWKSILGIPLEDIDLYDADILTYNYIRRLSEVLVKEEFERLCMEADISGTRFVFTSLNGEEIPLCSNGNDVLVTWDNRLEYAKAVRKYRLQELSCASRMTAIRSGLATIVPIHVLSILNPSDLEIRTCGIPNVDIDFLKVHTTYVAGIRPTDRHIEYFWNTLESFSQDQQRKFIKFACNQERLPGRCSCQDGTSDVHVPPFPMKIGPPDGRGPPDLRYIRVETCMFMVKLPRYTTQNVMKEKLLYAMNCREDPLTDFR